MNQTKKFGVVSVSLFALAACHASGTEPPTSTSSTEHVVSTTLADVTTTSMQSELPSTQRFSIPVGEDGVTYQLDGEPPSGPSSFVVLNDGSVVIADTMAANRGEPRLLHYDRTGEQVSIIELAAAEVASIADVVSDGTKLAILDVRIEREEYRVLFVSMDGDVLAEVDVPPGFRLKDGLTGLAWDDSGVLLEFELGARYARIVNNGAIEADVIPVFDELEVEAVEDDDRQTRIGVGKESWTVQRTTDLGGATLNGVSPDGTVVPVLDEVDTSGPAFEVLRRIQRYSLTGEALSESQIDRGKQRVDIMRPLELAADGEVLSLAALGDRLEVTPEPFSNSPTAFRERGRTTHTRKASQWSA